MLDKRGIDVVTPMEGFIAQMMYESIDHDNDGIDNGSMIFLWTSW